MFQNRNIRVCLAVGLCLLATVVVVSAQQKAVSGGGVSPETQAELDYAAMLQGEGLADYAEIVLSRIKDPSIGPRLKVAKLNNYLLVGKFAEADVIIKKEPDQASVDSWAMRLALADAYYAWNKYADAQAIYDAFFAKYKDAVPPALKSFYIESSYKYIQMLTMLGKLKEALKQYDIALKADPDKDTTRMFKGEKAELMLKLYESATPPEKELYKTSVTQIAKDLYWVQDLWFGKAVVLESHLKMMEGDVKGAQDHIQLYTEQLLQIDETLRKQEEETKEPLTKLSPMAQCRYQLGSMMLAEAEKQIAAKGERAKIVALLVGTEISGTRNRTAGALQHFLEVFIGYPTTSWAPDAGVKAQTVEDMVEKLGGKIKKNVTKEQWEKVEKSQLLEARVLFNQNQFENAAIQYIKVLSLFPESDTTIQALSELSKCFAEMGDVMASEAIACHIAERYFGNKKTFTKAGETVLALASYYDLKKLSEPRDSLYELFIGLYTAHPKASDMIMYVGENKLKEGKTKDALVYFGKAADTYPDRQVGLDALSKMAAAYAQETNTTAEIEILKRIIDNLEKKKLENYLYVSAKLRYASALKKQEPVVNNVKALNLFMEVQKLISEKKATIAKSAEELAGLADIYEAAIFSKALCYVQIRKPEEKIAEYKMQAVKCFQQLVDSGARSNKYAATSLSQIGTIYSILGNPAEAEKALSTLKAKYPESPEAKMIDYVLANNLLKMNKPKEATEAFKKMFEATDKYSEGQILKAGNELFDAKEFEIAAIAYKNTLGRTKETNMMTMATVGLGKVKCELKQYEESIKILEDILKNNQKSGYAVTINDYLRRAYTEQALVESNLEKRIGLFNKAVRALKIVKKYAKTPEELAAADIGICRISEYKAKSESEFGDKEKAAEYRGEAIVGYQIVMDGAVPTNLGAVPYYEEAFLKGTSMLAEDGKWDSVKENAELYIANFPKGKSIMIMRSLLSKAKVNASADGNKAKESVTSTAPQEDMSLDEEPAAKSTETAPAATVKPVAGVKQAEEKATVTAASAKPAGLTAKKAVSTKKAAVSESK